MPTQMISESKELQGVAIDILHLMEQKLSTHHFSRRNSRKPLDPSFVRFFCWVIIASELSAGGNDCPEILKDHAMIKSGIVTTRNWSWRMVLEEALKLLAVSEVYCFPQSDFSKDEFVCMSINFADGSSMSTYKMNSGDLITAVGLKALAQICELGIEINRRTAIPTTCIFVDAAEQWQAVKDAITAVIK